MLYIMVKIGFALWEPDFTYMEVECQFFLTGFFAHPPLRFQVDEKSKYPISFHDYVRYFHFAGRMFDVLQPFREYSLCNNTGVVTANRAEARVSWTVIGGFSIFVSSGV